MIVVRVELHSSVTREVTELARAHISNIGGTTDRGDYDVITLRGRSTADLDRRIPQRRGKVIQHQRRALHVWHLVAKALSAVGYGTPSPQPRRDSTVPIASAMVASELLAERTRQIEGEGWSLRHDDQHATDELAKAAACYAVGSQVALAPIGKWLWPWDPQWWKPADRRRDLVRAGALIIAEIERLDRRAQEKDRS